MNIYIMGVGAVGSYYGALLHKAGQKVTFIARGENLKALQEKGLQIKSTFGDFTINNLKAIESPQSDDKVDLILFTVKTYDTIPASQLIIPLITDDTVILPLQNVDMSSRIAEVTGCKKVIGGLTYVYVKREEPGVILHTSDFHKIVFGQFKEQNISNLNDITEVFESAGVAITLTEDIEKELWSKLIYIAATGSVGGMIKLPVGKYQNVPESRAIIFAAMKELETIAKAHGVNLDENIVEQKMAFFDNLEPNATSSTQRDIVEGRKSELEEMIGLSIQKAEKFNIEVPTLKFIYGVLEPREKEVRQI